MLFGIIFLKKISNRFDRSQANFVEDGTLLTEDVYVIVRLLCVDHIGLGNNNTYYFVWTILA